VTRELASFVGEAVLLPGMATRDRVSCELGELSLSGPISQGAVDVMLRPEQIRPLCAEDTMPNGAAVYDAVVTEVLFQGQDAGVALQLRSDARTMARAGARLSLPAAGRAGAARGGWRSKGLCACLNAASEH
jgi:iron(III) transport system ATP-binding protein